MRNLLAFGLLFMLDVIVEFGPMRLSVIRSSISMWQLSMMMLFSISPRLIVVLLPMLVYGPMYTLFSMVELSPIIVGPRIIAPSFIVVFSPIETLPCMHVGFWILLLISGFISSRMSLLASRISSGAPV